MRYIYDISPRLQVTHMWAEKLKKKQREYMFIGGMPEALQVWCKTGSVSEAAGYTLLSLPLYLVEALPKVLNDIREQVIHTAQ
jgi:hypothetical protein